MKLLSKSLFIFSLIIIVSCEQSNENTIEYNIYNVNNDSPEILDINYEEWPGKMLNLSDPLNPPFQTDSNGISVFVWNDSVYYHPVILATMADWFLDSFYQTEDTLYLNWSEKYLDKLEQISTDFDNAKFFPYPFNYNIHGIASELLVAPWYSGMAQGIALGDYSLMYKYTGNKKFLNIAYNILRSFDRKAVKDYPWVSYVDPSNYLWFEEYPNYVFPNHTLNGFLYGIFGLYEFYEITNDSFAKYLLTASITTVKHYINDFRVKNGLSYYCLKHKHQAENYHRLHISQLKSLYRITGDIYFSNIADSLYSDFH